MTCDRCGRPMGEGWRFSRLAVCDRRSCVASATHRLLRGTLPDDAHLLDADALERIARFDKMQTKNKPAPPPWKR